MATVGSTSAKETWKTTGKTIAGTFLATILAALLVTQGVMHANAADEPKQPTVTIEDSDKYITKVEILKGGANGTHLTTLTDENPEAFLLKRGEEYTLSVSVQKTNLDNTSGYVRLRFGVEAADGTVTANGLVFKNPPGSLFTEGSFDGHTYLDAVAVRTDAPDLTYGTNSSKYPMDDGVFIYHEKDSLSTGNEVKFYMQFSVDDVGYDNSGWLTEGLQLQTGTMDKNDTFVPDATLTASLPVESKPKLQGSYQSKALTATLGSTGQTAQYIVSEDSGKMGLIYDKITFDILYPKGASISDFGFDTAFNKTNTSRGKMKQIEGPQKEVNIDGVIYMSQSFEVSRGYMAEKDNPSYFYVLNFPKDAFSDMQTVTSMVTNTVYTFTDSKGNPQTIKVVEAAQPVTYTIKDPTKDATSLSAVNRTTGDGVFNITGVTDADTEGKLVTSFSGCRIQNTLDSLTPFEKTYEAQFNTTNTAAAITYVTVPLGNKNTVDNQPTVLLTGKTENGSIITKEVDNPLACRMKKEGAPATLLNGMVFRAADYGFSTFTGVKAEIGQLGKTDTCGWSSNFELSYNFSGAFGYFTTNEPGILVKNTYRLYNTDPTAQEYTGGDLSVTSQTVSASEARVGYTGNKTTIKDKAGKVTSAVYAGDTVSLNGYVYPYQVAYAEGYRVSGTPFPADANVYGNSSFVADPVIFVTLPEGMTLETATNAMSFTVRSYSMLDGYSKDVVLGPDQFTVENISYMNQSDDNPDANLYKISFPGTVLGYMIEEPNKSGTTGMVRNVLYYTMKLKTSKSLNTQTYYVEDLFGISSDNPVTALPYSNNRTTLNNVIKDEYGINGGRPYASLLPGTYENTGFGVQRQAEVNINNAVTVETDSDTWLSYDPTDANSVLMMGRTTKGQYRLRITNTSDDASDNVQVWVPLPKKDQSLGTAFMYGDNAGTQKFGFTMDVDLENAVLDGFKATYVKLSENIDVWNGQVTPKTEECTKGEANAILLTLDTAEPNKTYNVTLNYTVPFEENTPGKQNIFRNIFRYETGEGPVSSLGSYVACEIAEGKLTGTAFYDENRNGVQDSSEKVLSGISVVVKDTQNRTYSTTTDENGQYVFSSIREEDITATYSLGTGNNDYRFNVPGGELVAAADKKSAQVHYDKLPESATVNIPLDKPWTLTYDGNGPQDKQVVTGVVPAAQEYDPGNNIAVVSKNPDNLYCKFHVFDSWNTAADGSGTSYMPGAQITMTGDLTLYAQWKYGTYTATLDYQGGTSTTGITSFPVTYGDYFFDELPARETITREGYESNGWATNLTTTGRIGTKTTWNMENGTLYARYKEKSGFKVTYNTGGGTEVDAKENLTWTAPVLPDDKPTRTGYEFDCWTYDGQKVLDDTTYGELAKVDETTEITLEAKWTPKAIFTVNYNVNTPVGGGSVEPSDGYKALTGVSWTQDNLLPAQMPTCNGYAFAGWYYGTDGNAPKVEANTTYGDLGKTTNDSGNETELLEITLYAQWIELNTSKLVHYNTNGGTQVNDKVISDPAEDSLIPETEPTKPGSKFSGWEYKKSDETLVTIDDTNDTWNKLLGDSGSSTDSIELRAKWQARTYTIEYDTTSLAGSASPEKRTDVGWDGAVLSADANALINNDPIGYDVTGWQYNGAAVPEDAKVSGLIPKDDVEGNTLVLTPVYTENTYSVAYNTNGGGAIATQQGVRYTATNFVTASKPTKLGYTFTEWLYGSSKVDSTTAIKDLKIEKTTTSITLEAQYEVKTGFKVVFNTDGGSTLSPKENVSWTDKKLYYDDKGVPFGEPTKDGYTFDGWFDARNQQVTESTAYSDIAGNDDKEGSSITLVAHWKPSVYTITMRDANGEETGTDFTGSYATGAVVPKTHTYGTETALPTPTKEGCDFAGWYTDYACSGKVTKLDATDYTSDITLYAKWIKKIDITGLVKVDYGVQTDQQKARDVDLVLQRKTESGIFEQVGEPKNVGLNKVTTDTYAIGAFAFNDVPKTDLEGNEYTYQITANEANYVLSYPTKEFADEDGNPYKGNTKYNILLTYNPDTFKITMNVNRNEHMEEADVPVAVRLRVIFNPANPTEVGDNKGNFKEDTKVFTSADLGESGPDAVNGQWIYVTEHDTASMTLNLTNGSGSATHSVNEVWNTNGDRAYYQFVIDAYQLPDGTWVQNHSNQNGLPDNPQDNPYTVEYGEPCTYYDSDRNEATTALNVTISRKNTVTFDPQGGTAADVNALRNQTVVSGQTITEPHTTMTKTGYEFKGWYIEKDGEKEDWKFDTPVSGDMTLHAKWEPIRYTITFDNGAGVENTNAIATYDVSLPVITPPTADGKVFLGYYTGEGGKGDCWYDSTGTPTEEFATYKTKGNVTLYAHWDEGFSLPITVDASIIPKADRPLQVNVQVTYHANPTSNEKPTGDYNGASDEWPVVTQLGVSSIPLTDENGDGTFTGSYPVWKTTGSYTAYYQIHVVSYKTASGEEVQASAPPFFITGYGGCVSFSDVNTKSVTATIDRTYKVTFNPGEGVDVPVPQNVNRGETATDPTEGLTKEGHHISGWYTQDDVKWEFATSAVTKDMTLTARWEPNPYTINLYNSKSDIDNGEDSLGSASAIYNAVLPTILPLADTEEYLFDGFYAAAGDSEICYYNAQGKAQLNTYTQPNDINLYAKWIKKTDVVGKLKLNYTYQVKVGDDEQTVVMPNPQRLGSVQVFLERKLKDVSDDEWSEVESVNRQTLKFEGFQPENPSEVPYMIGDFSFTDLPSTDTNGNAYKYRVSSETVNYVVEYEATFTENEPTTQGLRALAETNDGEGAGGDPSTDTPNYNIELKYQAETFDLFMTVDASTFTSGRPESVDLKVAFIWYNPDEEFKAQGGKFDGIVDGNPFGNDEGKVYPHRWRYPGDFFPNFDPNTSLDTGVLNVPFENGVATTSYTVTSQGLRNGDSTVPEADANKTVPYYYQFVIVAYHMADGTVIKTGEDTDLFEKTWNQKYAVFNAEDETKENQKLSITLDREYTVSFDLQDKGKDSNGNKATIDPVTVKNGNAVDTPSMDSIAEPGYRFDGWYTDAGCTDGNEWVFKGTDNANTVSEDTTLYAKWTLRTYDIEYKNKGGEEFVGDYDDGVIVPTEHTYGTDTLLPEPHREGWDFAGWYTDSACTAGNRVTELGATEFSGNTETITLYANWIEKTDVTGLVKLDYKDQVSTQKETSVTVYLQRRLQGETEYVDVENASVVVPFKNLNVDTDAYALDSFTFKGVPETDENGTPYEYRATANLANYDLKRGVKFDNEEDATNNLEFTYNPARFKLVMNVTADEYVSTADLPTAVRLRVAFNPANPSNEVFTNDTVPLTEADLKAGNITPSKTVSTWIYISEHDAAYLRVPFTGNTASGIYSVNQWWNAQKDQAYYQFVIDGYEMADGSFVKNTHGAGEDLFEVDYGEGGCITSTNGEDRELSVTLHRNNTVTFALQGGKATGVGTTGGELDAQKVQGGKTVIDPLAGGAIITKPGYTFGGWYADAACTDDSKWVFGTEDGANKVTTDTVIYAKWVPNTNISYTVNYYLQGTTTSVANSKTVKDQTMGAEATEAAASVTGYTPLEPASKTITLKANNADNVITFYYKADPAYIIFEENQGSVVADMEGVTGQAIANTVMPTITREGYAFAGWYDNADCSGEAVTKLPDAYPAGATTYYAKWTPATNTAYTVKHWFQNADGNGYTQNLADYPDESETGTTGQQTNASAKTVTGFTAQDIEQQTIAADGGTVVDIYYDRNTYTVTTNLTNLEAPEAPSTVQYGQALSVTLKPMENYALPPTVSVTIGGVAYAPAGLYDSEKGVVSIPATAITGDVVIQAAGVQKTFAITYDLQHVTASQKPSTVDTGETCVINLAADSKYALPETVAVTIGGKPCSSKAYAYDRAAGTLTIYGSNLTGNVSVQVVGAPSAQTPAVSKPDDAVYTINQPTTPLTVAVSGVTDGGELSYQWYVADSPSGAGSPIDGAKDSSYRPSSTTAGTCWYYCVVTNKVTYSDGTLPQTSTAESGRAEITVKNSDVTAQVPQLKPLASATYTLGTPGADVTALDPKATVTDGGVLSFQWYQKVDGAADFQKMEGDAARRATLTPDISAVGTCQYYCEVTNTVTDAYGNVSVATASNKDYPAIITVVESAPVPTVNAQPPSITDPTGGTYTLGEQIDLAVTATSPDGGRLDYQWFTSVDGKNSGGTPIPGATSSEYTPTIDTAGTYYFYCEVTNTITGENVGNPVAKAASNAAVVVVSAPPAPVHQAQKPSLVKSPASATYQQHASTEDLLVEAKVTDGGTLTFQWFESTDGTNQNGTPLGAPTTGTQATYHPSSDTVGDRWYYCVITNTKTFDDGDVQTTTETTDAAKITVTAPQLLTVTFDANDGNGIVKTFTLTDLKDGVTIADPGTVKRPGYVMTGWFADSLCTVPWNFATDKVTKDTVLYAGWKACGHEFGPWTVVRPATETQDGLEERVCGLCGQVEQRAIPKLGTTAPNDQAGTEKQLATSECAKAAAIAKTGDEVGKTSLLLLLLAACGSTLALVAHKKRKEADK